MNIKRVGYTLLYYLMAFGAVIAAHKISPTNMAGFGLDLVVYPIVFIASVFFFGKSYYNAEKNNEPALVPNILNLLGIVGLFLLLFI